MELFNQPKTKKGQDTLDKILIETERLFSEKGYYETSVKDITDAANVGTGTFYIYFESKLSLYKVVLDEYGKTIRNYLTKQIMGSSSRKEAERRGIRAFVEMVRERPSMYNVIWQALYIDKQIFVDYYENFSARYMKQIKEAQIKGEISADYDPEVISYMLIGISNFIGLRYAIFDGEEDLDPIMDDIISILEKGMFT